MAGSSDHLNNNTKKIYAAASDDSPFATNDVGDVTSDDRAEEGTAGEDRGDQRLVRRGESRGVGTLDDVDEFGDAIDTVDVPRVIAEEDTAEGREGADEVGLPGDWSLNTVHVICGRQSTDLARHVGGLLKFGLGKSRRSVLTEFKN